MYQKYAYPKGKSIKIIYEFNTHILFKILIKFNVVSKDWGEKKSLICFMEYRSNIRKYRAKFDKQE